MVTVIMGGPITVHHVTMGSLPMSKAGPAQSDVADQSWSTMSLSILRQFFLRIRDYTYQERKFHFNQKKEKKNKSFMELAEVTGLGQSPSRLGFDLPSFKTMSETHM